MNKPIEINGIDMDIENIGNYSPITVKTPDGNDLTIILYGR